MWLQPNCLRHKVVPPHLPQFCYIPVIRSWSRHRSGNYFYSTRRCSPLTHESGGVARSVPSPPLLRTPWVPRKETSCPALDLHKTPSPHLSCSHFHTRRLISNLSIHDLYNPLPVSLNKRSRGLPSYRLIDSIGLPLPKDVYIVVRAKEGRWLLLVGPALQYSDSKMSV